MKNLKSILKGLSLLFLVVTLAACSRSSDNDNDINIDTSVGEYYIKVTGSSDVAVDMVSVFADGAGHTLQIGKKVPYTSPKYKAGNISFSVTAMSLTNDINSTLVVELIKDGKVVKTSKSKGIALVVSISN